MILFTDAENRFISAVKIEDYVRNIIIFNIFAQNIDCEYTLEPHRRDGFNKYQQSMFWSRNKKYSIHLHTAVILI